MKKAKTQPKVSDGIIIERVVPFISYPLGRVRTAAERRKEDATYSQEVKTLGKQKADINKWLRSKRAIIQKTG